MLKNKKGFTLVELLAVIVVLAIIAVIGYSVVSNVIETSQEESDKTTVRNYAKAVEQARMNYYVTYGKYPENDELKNIIKFSNSEIDCEEIDYNNGSVILNNCNINNSKNYCYSNSQVTECDGNVGEPDLLNDSLTPVFYNNGSWVVADKISDEWYNYSEGKWANAVILKSGVTKSVGDSIFVESDVKAMYVWIPRYEYKIGKVEDFYLAATNTEYGIYDAYTSAASISINLISKSQMEASSGYEIHPAFKFGDTIISGFWVGKFETTGESQSPTVLPNKIALTNQSIAEQFATAKKFGSYLTSSTNIDAHMMKNSEWGAVAYLTQSKYGYYSDGKLKNQISVAGDKTGESTNRPAMDDQGSFPLFQPELYSQYDIGTSSSTTGNIYGVYDMSGGKSENVMGVYNKNKSASGFTAANWPDSKYYDNYTDGDFSLACSNRKCDGHALIETKGWYFDNSAFLDNNNAWLNRGGYIPDNKGTGIFAYYSVNGDKFLHYSFRSVLLSEI